MTNQLIALLDGREVGTVNYKNARLSFVYNDEWRIDPNTYPLSLSMPLASAEHGHARIEAFLWGLLPDNDRVLENWGRRFQVSPKNVFRLIAHVGEDCAGAVQFVRPERLEALQSGTVAKEVKWLTEDDVAERLRALRVDHSAWRSAQTQDSSASPARNPRPLFSSSANGGAFRLAAFQRRIFSSRPRANGTATRRTSTSRCAWPGQPG